MSCLRGKLEMLIQPDSDNDTPLHICIANKLMVQAVFLLERFIQENVDFDIPNRWGLTPLFVAVDLAKDPAMVTYLLEKGSNPNISMKKCGRSPLHVAAQGKQNCLPIVKALLKCETTNILARNDKGETALHDAVRNHNVRRKLNEVSNEMSKVDSIPVVQQLLAHANGQKLINEISNDNLSAFNIAMESGEVSIELLKLLSRNGAEISDTDKKMIKKYCPKVTFLLLFFTYVFPVCYVY
ncbi:B-cell lymphoma 3 protein [Nymphon striatum]|nr:B-cell lymphoma 3 protein [Nymphon striatum]